MTREELVAKSIREWLRGAQTRARAGIVLVDAIVQRAQRSARLEVDLGRPAHERPLSDKTAGELVRAARQQDPPPLMPRLHGE